MTSTSNWEKEFDEKFSEVVNDNPRIVSTPSQATKDFISSLLTTAKQEGRDEAATLVENWHINKGGYTELAHVIRESARTSNGEV